MHFLYGENIPGTFVFCVNWNEAKQYGRMPAPGKYIHKLSDTTTYDELVAKVGSSVDGSLMPLLKEKLVAYRQKYNIPTPLHDCDKFKQILTGKKHEAVLPLTDMGESSDVLLPTFEKKVMNVNMTSPSNPYVLAASKPGTQLPLCSVQLCLPQAISFYVDGSCLDNHFGGFAAIPLDGGRPIAFLSGAGEVDNSTDAEWHAVHLALKSLMTEHHQVWIYSDCMDVVRVMNGVQKVKERSAAFIQLYREVYALCQCHDVRVAYVKGHAGNEWNEVADTLAKRQAMAYRDAYQAASLQMA